MCIFCHEERHGVMSYFGKLIGIAMTRRAMLVHGEDLCLCGDAVEELFDIIADSRAGVMRELLCVFEEYDVVKFEVINGFPFAVNVM